MSNLRSKVRRRIRYGALDKSLKSTFKVNDPSRRGSVVGTGLVSIEGRTYPASVSDTVDVGATIELYNAGRPAAALYVPTVGGGAAAVAGSGSGAGGGGGGGGMELHTLDGEYHEGTLAWNSVSKTGSNLTDIVTRPHSSLTGITASDHHPPVNTAAGSGLDLVVATQAITVDVTDLLGAGITEDGANNLKVNTAYNFAWTGTHSFAATTTFNATSIFNQWVDVNAAITASSTLNIEGDINLAASLIFDGASATIQTLSNKDLTVSPHGTGKLHVAHDTYFSTPEFENTIPYIQGWQFHPANAVQSQLTISKLYLDELYTRVFVADEVRVDRGEEFWGKSLGILSEEQTGPSYFDGAGVTFWFEDSPALTGAIFAEGDWLMNRIFDDSGGLSISTNWYQCYSYHQGTVGEGREGEQSWTLKLRYGTTSLLHKKGQLFIDFGVTSQGLIHLSTLNNADGPWINMFTWSGNPYVPANREAKTVIGKLDSFNDPVMDVSGYGIYSTNAFLRGALHAGDSVIDSEGIQFFTATRAEEIVGDKLRWLRGDTLVEYANVSSFFDDSSNYYWSRYLLDVPTNKDGYMVVGLDTGGTGDGELTLTAQLDSVAAQSIIWLKTYNATQSSEIEAQADKIILNADDLMIRSTDGVMYPVGDQMVDLGTPSKQFGTVYADAIVADTITGNISVTENIGGQIWLFDGGSMYIVADWPTDRTLHIYNTGAGELNVNIAGDLLVQGDFSHSSITANTSAIAAHLASSDPHHDKLHDIDDATVHFGSLSWSKVSMTGSDLADLETASYADLSSRSHLLATNLGLGPDHTMSGASAGWVLRAVSGTGAAWAQLNYSDLAGTPDADVGPHELASMSGLGTKHTVSGLTTNAVLLAVTPTIARFQVLHHDGLSQVSANDHHNQVHTYDGNDHSGTLNWSNVDFSGMTLGDLGTMAHSSLTGIGAEDHHALVTGGDGITMVGQAASVSLAASSGLTFSVGALTVNSSIAGSGLSWNSGVMAVGAGDGITLGVDSVSVNAADLVAAGMTVNTNNFQINYAYDHTWSGRHTFNNTIDTNSLIPTLTDTYDIGSSDDWYRAQFVSTINAAVFAENTIQVIGGWFFIAKMQGTFQAEVFADDTTIDFGQDNTILAAGDFILVKAHKALTGDIATEYMTLVSYDVGTELWTVTRDTSGAHVTDPDWSKGTPWVLLGNTGDGRIEFNAWDGLGSGHTRPKIQVITQGATYNVQNERMRLGNLYGTGLIGAVDRYGIMAGNDVGLTATEGFSGFSVDNVNGMSLYGSDIHGYEQNIIGTYKHSLEINGRRGIIKLATVGTNVSAFEIYDDNVDSGRAISGIEVESVTVDGSNLTTVYARSLVQYQNYGRNLLRLNTAGPGANQGANIDITEYPIMNRVDYTFMDYTGAPPGQAAFTVFAGKVYADEEDPNFVAWEGSFFSGRLTMESYGGSGDDMGVAMGLSKDTGDPAISFSGQDDNLAVLNFSPTDGILSISNLADHDSLSPTLSINTTSRWLGVGVAPTAALDVYTGASRMRMTVQPGFLSLADSVTAGRLPYIEWRETFGGNRAMYLGWGSTTTKYLDMQMENDYELRIVGAVAINKDVNLSAVIGRARVGHMGYSDQAGFAHIDHNSITNYALKQSNAGSTSMNSASGQMTTIRRNDVETMRFDSSGRVAIGMTDTSNAHFSIYQPSAVAGLAPIYINQADVDAPMIKFACTAGANNGISASPVGGNSYKIKVIVNGYERWIQTYL